MSEAPTDQINHFNSVIRECETFCFLPRDSELQRDARTKLQNLSAECHSLKSAAIGMHDENLANLFLGYECVIDCLHSELSMWILLKEENPDAAWDRLIAAQMAADAAARAHSGFSHLQHQSERLESIERLIFPPQVFVSAGLIVRYQECSICGAEYGYCEHLAGKPYCGEFCCIVTKDIEANHIAVVDDPADKRCRITHFDVEGGKRNRMTWKVDPANPQNTNEPTPDSPGNGPNNPLRAQARILHVR
jgi:hypothetical protein